MKKTAFFFGGLILFAAVFWIGLVVNFPGEAMSRLIESRVNSGSGINIAVNPARLTLGGLALDDVRVGWHRGENSLPLVALREVLLPFTPQLLKGLKLEISVAEKGTAGLFFPWGERGFSLEAAELRLEDFRGWSELGPMRMRGLVALEGNFTLPKPSRRRAAPLVPVGTLSVAATNVEISGLEILGGKFPATRFEEVSLKLRSEKRIQVEEASFRGDLQGTVTGSITPRGADGLRSILQLRVAAAVRQSWLQKLGAMRPIVEAFVKNGRLAGNLAGTVGAPRWSGARGSK